MAMSAFKSKDPRMDRLTLKQAEFVRQFLYGKEGVAGNAQASALEAGYKKPKSGSLNAHQTLNHPNVQRAIGLIFAERMASNEGDLIKAAVSRIAMSDMSNFLSVTEDGRFELDAKKALHAGAIGQIKKYQKNKDGSESITLHDPLPPLQLLAKFAGIELDRGSDDKPLVVKILRGVSMEEI